MLVFGAVFGVVEGVVAVVCFAGVAGVARGGPDGDATAAEEAGAEGVAGNNTQELGLTLRIVRSNLASSVASPAPSIPLPTPRAFDPPAAAAAAALAVAGEVEPKNLSSLRSSLSIVKGPEATVLVYEPLEAAGVPCP